MGFPVSGLPSSPSFLKQGQSPEPPGVNSGIFGNKLGMFLPWEPGKWSDSSTVSIPVCDSD